jgi:hypothetical protein
LQGSDSNRAFLFQFSSLLAAAYNDAASMIAKSQTDEPRLLQIKANQMALTMGVAVPLVFASIFFFDWMRPARTLHPSLDLTIAALCAAISIYFIAQLINGAALIIATPDGLKLRILVHGYVLVPWRRVESVVVTQVATLAGHTGGARVDALGIYVIEDDTFHLPKVQWNADHPAPEAPQTNLTISSRMIQCDVQILAQELEQLRKRYGG